MYSVRQLVHWYNCTSTLIALERWFLPIPPKCAWTSAVRLPLEWSTSPRRPLSTEIWLLGTSWSQIRGLARSADYCAAHSMIEFKIYPGMGTFQIADFGMARDLEEGNYYVSHGGKIPVKWTAPEVSIKSLKQNSSCEVHLI